MMMMRLMLFRLTLYDSYSSFHLRKRIPIYCRYCIPSRNLSYIHKICRWGICIYASVHIEIELNDIFDTCQYYYCKDYLQNVFIFLYSSIIIHILFRYLGACLSLPYTTFQWEMWIYMAIENTKTSFVQMIVYLIKLSHPITILLTARTWLKYQ